MSFNRENVIWQSKDGTWTRAFYEVVWQGDGDPEWDVEYGSEFWWASFGHATEQAAADSWDGSNPGGYTSMTYADSPEACDKYDAMVAAMRTNGERSSWWGANAITAPGRHG